MDTMISSTYVAPNSHCTAGFDLFHRRTKWNPVSMPLSWNIQTKSFNSVAVFCPEYYAWGLCIWGVLGLLTLATSLCVIINVQLTGMASAVICSGWIGMSTLMWTSATVTCYHWDAIVRGFHGYNGLTRVLDSIHPFAALSFKIDLKWTVIGKILKGVIEALLGISFLLLPCVVFQKLVPFGFPFSRVLCRDWESCKPTAVWTVYILRWAFSYIIFIEGGRICAIFFPTLLYIYERQMHCLYVLKWLPPKHDPDHGIVHFRWYNALRVADRLCNEPFCSVMCVAMGSGFTLWVWVNVVSLKCYSILPMSVYWLMPSLSIIIFILTAVIFSTIVNIRAESESQFSAKILWADNSHQKINRKLISMKVRSMRPICMKCGQLYSLTKNSKITFFYDVVLRTVDGCMLPIFD